MDNSTRPDDTLLKQGRALGDPTRNAIFVHIRDAHLPPTVAELTDAFGLNHNAIRQHLAKLRDAGLVTEEVSAPVGPGRPARRYRLVPGVSERWGGPGPHETLSTMLLELLDGKGTPLEVGRSMGRRLAAEYGDELDGAEVLGAVARRLGFEPETEPTQRGLDLVLGKCPFVDQATAAPQIVCSLHHGIAEGIAQQASGGVNVDDLIARSPLRAGCRIEVSEPAG